MNLDVQYSQLVFMPKDTGCKASVTEGLGQIGDLGGPWEHVQLPKSEINTHGEDDIPAPLSVIDNGRPPEPSQREKDVYGIAYATEKAHDRWLILAAEAICSSDDPKAAQAYRDCARTHMLLLKLERQVLIDDIKKSSLEVQGRLSQNVVLLLLNLVDHRSDQIQIYQESDREWLIAKLVNALRISLPPKRPRDEEVQTTSLIRALLEMSGGRIDCQQHVFSDESTTSMNAELFASVFGITTTRGFGDADVQEMIAIIASSPLFSRSTMNAQDLDDRTMEIGHSLLLGHEHDSLKLPLQVLTGLSFGQVQEFRQYLSDTYTTTKVLKGVQNNRLVLLSWTLALYNLQAEAANRHLGILQKWADSEEGKSFYNDLARRAQGSQTVEQLVLIMVAMLGYSRLVPDCLDHFEAPLRSSYLVDLDTHFRGSALGNRGRVAEHMIFAMTRVLSTFRNRYGHLVTFLAAALDREPPLLHPLAGLSDQYSSLRIGGADHKTAFRLVMIEASRLLSETDIRRLHSNESHNILVTRTVDVSPSTKIADDTTSSYVATTLSSEVHRRLAQSNVPLDRYRLARLSNIEDKNVWSFFESHVSELKEVPSVVAIGDGTYEVVILDSYRDTLRSQLNALLPSSEFELEYDPLRPTEADLAECEYEQAKAIRKGRFLERAMRQIREGWSTAAAYYAYLLGVLLP